MTPVGAAGDPSPAPAVPCIVPGCIDTDTRQYAGPPYCKPHALAYGLQWPEQRIAPNASRERHTDWRLRAYREVMDDDMSGGPPPCAVFLV